MLKHKPVYAQQLTSEKFADPLQTSLSLKSFLWPALTVLAVLLQLFFPSRIWMSLLIILGGGWIIAVLWARSLSLNLKATRELRYGLAQVGDRLEERFHLINQGWSPGFWVEIVDHSTMPDYPVSRVTSIGFLTTQRWLISSQCNRMGIFTLGPTTLRSADPLGIYQVNIFLPGSTVLTVMPPTLPLPQIEIAPGVRAGESRRAKPGTLERSFSSATVRPFQPGEDTRWIHWPTSARHDELFTRLFDATPASDWWIFLDLEECRQMGIGENSTDEYGIILAASLSARGLLAGNSVGLVMHGKDLTWIPPQRGQTQRMDILRSLAVACRGEKPLSALLRNAQKSLSQRACLILITPDITGEWLPDLLPLLGLGTAPTVFLFDPVSFTGS